MKKIKLLFIIAVAVISFQACTSGNHSANANDTAKATDPNDKSNLDTARVTTALGDASVEDNGGSGGTSHAIIKDSTSKKGMAKTDTAKMKK